MSKSRSQPSGDGFRVESPDYMHAFDGGEWTWYVHGHDRDECWQLDDPELLRTEALYMRPIRASQAEDYGFYPEDGETVVRNRETGRFESVWCWIECGPEHRDAAPFLGVSYLSDALTTEAAPKPLTPKCICMPDYDCPVHGQDGSGVVCRPTEGET